MEISQNNSMSSQVKTHLRTYSIHCETLSLNCNLNGPINFLLDSDTFVDSNSKITNDISHMQKNAYKLI